MSLSVLIFPSLRLAPSFKIVEVKQHRRMLCRPDDEFKFPHSSNDVTFVAQGCTSEPQHFGKH